LNSAEPAVQRCLAFERHNEVTCLASTVVRRYTETGIALSQVDFIGGERRLLAKDGGTNNIDAAVTYN